MGTNSSISTTEDKYAALRQIDEQFREIKSTEKSTTEIEAVSNPFKTMNPFQQSDQSYQNWNIPSSSTKVGNPFMNPFL
jgi:hypothetical protein